MYFTNDRIYLRKGTVEALKNPSYIRLSINRGNKLLIITPCEKNKDSFRMHYEKYYFYNEESRSYEYSEEPHLCFIYAKKLLDFLAQIVNVERNSISLRFEGILHNGEVIIDLKHYEFVIYEKEEEYE